MRKIPLITIILVLCTLIATLPQFLIGGEYNYQTSFFPADFSVIHRFLMPVFTHTPEILTVHFFSNLAVIVLFGGLFELVAGSKRFSLVALSNLLCTILFSFLAVNGKNPIHGVSHICFGFMMVFLYLIIVLYNNKELKKIKNPLLLFMSLLAFFNVFVTPFGEVDYIQKYNLPVEHHGLTVHLITYFVSLFYILLWREDLECNLLFLIKGKKAYRDKRIHPITCCTASALLFFTLWGTVSVLLSL